VLVQFLDNPVDHHRQRAGGSAEQQAYPCFLSHDVPFRYCCDVLSLPSGTSVPSVLLTAKWVTTSNMASTVIADQFVKTSQLCVGNFVAACKAAGIS